MAAPLSVIIPVGGEEHRLGPCLGALSDGLMDGLLREVILVDHPVSDALRAIAEETGAQVVSAPAGTGHALRSAGLRVARGDWTMILHPLAILPPGWPAALRLHFKHTPANAAAFRLPGVRAFSAHAGARLLGRPAAEQPVVLPRALREAKSLRKRLALLPATVAFN
ncbi:MAG: glycosyltransferase [Rubricella sp.]